MYFVDTSALVKAYIVETGSETVREAFDLLGGSLCISDLIAAETLGAFAKMLRRKQIKQKAYSKARDDFLRHLYTKYYVVPVPQDAFMDGLALIHTHRARSVGSNDLLHITTAEHLQSIIRADVVAIICSDSMMREIAEQRGFDVFDPETDPIDKLLPPALPLS